MRKNDLILLIVLALSVLAGILFPYHTSFLQPYPLYGMMAFMFLSFLSIRLSEVRNTVQNSWHAIVILSIVKMLILPILMYYLCLHFWPKYALAILLLTGTSTGVVAPFIANLVGANSALVLVMVVVTALLVPFTLPALVKILAAETITISLFSMIRLLTMVIFIPLTAVELLRYAWPSLSSGILARRYPLSLILFALINMGIFSGYSEYFFQNPAVLVETAVLGIILGGLYIITGIVCLWRNSVDNQLSGSIAMTNINNVLIIVFAAQFFSPLEPTLAAMYMAPFFLSIIPMRIYRKKRRNTVNKA